MALTLTQLKAWYEHVAGGAADAIYTDASTTEIQYINEAGQALLACHPWQFLKRTPALLDFAAPIAIANGTWTESSKTLTKTSGFTNYTYVAGDRITITDGADATTGEYTIASKTSNNAIVLEDSIGSDADADTDIDGTIYFPYVNLPSDFAEMLGPPTAEGTYGLTMEPVTLDRLELIRASTIAFGNHYYWALAWPAQSATSVVAPNPRLEIWPPPSAALISAVRIPYRAGWVVLSSATVPNVPVWFEPAVIGAVGAIADEYENDKRGALGEFLNGPLIETFKQRDTRTQWNFGQMQGGGAGLGQRLPVIPHSTQGAIV